MLSCSMPTRIYEDTLYITRKYVGRLDSTVIEPYVLRGGVTHIYTDSMDFYLDGMIELDAQQGDKCYLRYIHESTAGSMWGHWVLYFTWNGTEDLYMLRQDRFTGEVY